MQSSGILQQVMLVVWLHVCTCAFAFLEGVGEREEREREREREREKAVYDTYYMYVLLLSVIVKCTTCVNAYMCIYSECQRRDWNFHKVHCCGDRPTPTGLPFVVSLPQSNSRTQGWPTWLRNLQVQQFH